MDGQIMVMIKSYFVKYDTSTTVDVVVFLAEIKHDRVFTLGYTNTYNIIPPEGTDSRSKGNPFFQ